VACSWKACFTLHHSVSEEDRTPTELRVQEDLIKWHPASLDAFKDLQIFVVERLQSESDRSKRRELLELSIATWIVWNVTQKRPIPREFETVAAVASIIAPEFMNYWQQPLEPG
jgi:hypothetical protein